MGAAVRFKQLNVPRQQGEQARLKVVQGPDYGVVYVITGPRTTLGRGEECDIMVSDLKASRRHAEIIMIVGGWQVRDLGSANGLLHNGKPVREARIQSGDALTFGETTLEFMTSVEGTMMLVAPPKNLDQLNLERANLEIARKRARGLHVIQGGAGGAPQAPNRKILLYLAAGGAALWLMMGDSQHQPSGKPGKKNPNEQSEDLSKYLPTGTTDVVTSRSAEQFFKAGFREYLAGNYLRAKAQFETVLQMAPGHLLATLYLENCENAIRDEVKFHLDQGQKGTAAGKFKESRAHYEAVLRILFRDQSNPSYVEARDQLEKVNKLLAGAPEGQAEGGK